MNRNYSEMTDAQIVDEILQVLKDRHRIKDGSLYELFYLRGLDETRLKKVIADARAHLKATK